MLVNPTGDIGSVALEPVDLAVRGEGAHDEEWLQKLLHDQPSLIPVDDIEPAFSGLTPVCRELPTGVGPIDNVYVNERGLLTFVECKLWRNPEARRKVVGQILDYAQQVSRWMLADFDAALGKSVAPAGAGLWEIAKEAFSLDDEARFLDRVQHHLSNGTFLLLIVGDGIRESTEDIARFMNQHAGLSFALGLVEMGLFNLPGDERLLVQPRVLAKTVEIGRLIVRAEDGVRIEQTDNKAAKQSPGSSGSSRRTLTEELFIEEVAGNSSLADKLREFFAKIQENGLRIEATPRGASLKIVAGEPGMNIATLSKKGTWRNYGCGDSEEGRRYLRALAALFPDGVVKEGGNDGGWSWTVQSADGRNYHIEDLVAHADEWLALLRDLEAND
ncbi:hypothetical protein [Haloferula sp. A504]|uniref:hypothetical protein n=1 Tax=Haloferula sp. A504 TaxID=3373601 RepID=UPI0031C6A9BB|nr:hypothetical protein [Verrucomicrobiaceae bacterium E54]